MKPLGPPISTTPTPIPTALLLEELPAFAADVRRAMDTAAAHRGDAYLNADGGDLGGGISTALLVRHAANHLAALQVVQAIGVPTDDLLDVGCGTGATAATMARWMGARLHLSDQDPAPLEVARRAFDPESATTDVADSPVVDVVTSMDVVEHVPAPGQADFVAALASRVRPGGVLALATPDESSYPGGWSGYRPHIGCLSPTQLGQLLDKVTGRPVTVLRLSGGPFDISLARRSWERVANAAWGRMSSALPQQTAALARTGSRSQPSADAIERAAGEPVVAVDPARTRSTGLLAFVRL